MNTVSQTLPCWLILNHHLKHLNSCTNTSTNSYLLHFLSYWMGFLKKNLNLWTYIYHLTLLVSSCHSSQQELLVLMLYSSVFPGFLVICQYDEYFTIYSSKSLIKYLTRSELITWNFLPSWRWRSTQYPLGMTVQLVINPSSHTCTQNKSAWMSCVFLSVALLQVNILLTYQYSNHLNRVKPRQVQQDLFLTQPWWSLAISATFSRDSPTDFYQSPLEEWPKIVIKLASLGFFHRPHVRASSLFRRLETCISVEII